MLPESFNFYRALPQDFDVTFADIRNSLLIHGPAVKPLNWNSKWRLELLGNLEIVVRQLWGNGIETVYVDGSFVTGIGHPRDIDACFECDFTEWSSGALAEKLNQAAPKKVWTWDDSARRTVAGFTSMKLPMWCSYRVDIHPYFPDRPNIGMMMDDGSLVTVLDGFRRMRNMEAPKGILKLIKD